MKFAHLADCHIGSWRDKLSEKSIEAFAKAVDICIERQVDFVLIAGDFFNTSLPSIDRLKLAVNKLKMLKDKDICVYIIPGSHDFSPSGKTMLDVLEEAGLVENVVKGEVIEDRLHLRFTINKKTGAKITGILGKRGMLDKHYYNALSKKELEDEDGFKIFMFHTAIEEFKPKDFEGINVAELSTLPKNFNYYAGGHVHYLFDKKVDEFGLIVYPGPLFPNNFTEIEDLHSGGFCIYEDGVLERINIEFFEVVSFSLNCNAKNPDQIWNTVKEEITHHNLCNALVTLRFFGKISEGKVSDINFKGIIEEINKQEPYAILKNTNALTSREFEEVKVELGTADEIEVRVIKENSGKFKHPFGDEIEVTEKLIKFLNTEKKEGERQVDFEERLKKSSTIFLGYN